MLARVRAAPAAASTPVLMRKIDKNELNIVGEDHDASKQRRAQEKAMLRERYQIPEDHYWSESGFAYEVDGETQDGDSLSLLAAQDAAYLLDDIDQLKRRAQVAKKKAGVLCALLALGESSATATEGEDGLGTAQEEFTESLQRLLKVLTMAESKVGHLETVLADMSKKERTEAVVEAVTTTIAEIAALLRALQYDPSETTAKELIERVGHDRSKHMHQAAARSNLTGVWKVGESHITDMQALKEKDSKVTLTPRAEFEHEFESWRKAGPKAPTEAVPP